MNQPNCQRCEHPLSSHFQRGGICIGCPCESFVPKFGELIPKDLLIDDDMTYQIELKRLN